MSNVTRLPDPACREARDRIHALLDGDALEPVAQRRLAEHLAGCSGCRDFDRELKALQGDLRDLGRRRLPAAALDEVWQRTTRARPQRARSRVAHWRGAAAAVLALALVGAWLVGDRSTPEPDARREDELLRAAAEARVVLNLTAQALNRARGVAVRDVLAAEVSDTLRRAPIEWPRRKSDDGGRSGT